MIIAIADDITGAAEIGGIGLRYGLKTLLLNDLISADVDLLVIYTNTRSLPEADAIEEMRVLTKKALAANPELLYKKTDSVLRGHVLAEMKAQMEAAGLTKGLLVPVNPLMGRTIQNGIYYVNDRPVHEAGFANDPEFPMINSDVESMLGAMEGEVSLRAGTDQLTEGINVGEASTVADVNRLAAVNDPKIFYAGAGSFFAALLHQRFDIKKVETIKTLSSPLLLVSGTTYMQSINKQFVYQQAVCRMPAEIFEETSIDEKTISAWANDVANRLQENKRCIMAVGVQKPLKTDPELIRRKVSAAVEEVLKKVPVHELLIEGGATAFSVVEKLGYSAFLPSEELQQGVVRMKVIGKTDLHMTIKPGSYPWPEGWDKAFPYSR